MEKLKMQSLDVTGNNIDKIAQLFPNCVTERIGKDGKPEMAIDFDKLKAELTNDVLEEGEERYQFTWPGKRAASRLANETTTQTLRPCREESVDFDNTQNLYIEGDNLEVLKVLRETYLGKVKMIYIDPPYNTGNDFVYNDDFAQGSNDFEQISGFFDDEGNQTIDPLQRNTEKNGRFHTDWLNMIYPRLKVAKDLLTEDGIIFISIDDKEVDNLGKVCSEIFGKTNYIGTLVLQTATDNNPRQITTEHEYIVCYAKNKSIQTAWTAKNHQVELIQNKYNSLKEIYGDNTVKIQEDLRKWIKSNKDELEGIAHYDNVDEKGVFHDGDIANTVFGGYKYDVIHPITGKACKIPEKGFRYPESTMMEMIESGDIMFGVDETTLIKPKKRLENAKDLLRSIIYEDGRSSTKQFESLMSRDIFQNPKSVNILSRLMDFTVADGDIVIDFFSGSGSTAEATMNLYNKVKKNIKFILVQIPEDLNVSILTASSRAKQTLKNAIKFLDSINKPHTVCEIGKERIRRAGKKIKDDELDKLNEELNYLVSQRALIDNDFWCNSNELENKIKELEDKIKDLWRLDTGFRVLKLDSSNMNDVYYTPEEFSLNTLFSENVKEDRTAEDLLFQVMLDLGIELSAKIEKQEIAGKEVFLVDGNYLIACFDKDVNETTITEIAKMHPVYFVMRDASAASDNVIDNFDQLFEAYSKDTVRKIL